MNPLPHLRDDIAVETAKKICPTSDPEIQEILTKSVFDTAYFCQHIMAESYAEPMTEQRLELCRYLDDETIRYLVECGWRGLAKTALTSGKVIKDALFRVRQYQMYVGQTYETAEDQTEIIRTEIVTNPIIREIWGKLTSKTYEDVNVKQGRRGWYLCEPNTGEPFMLMQPKGSGQAVRGRNVLIGRKRSRPDMIVVDDPEHDKEVANEVNRKAFQKWLHGSLMECLGQVTVYAYQGRDERSKEMARVYGKKACMGRIVYIDTLKHEDARIAHLLEDGMWKGVRHSMADIIQREDYEARKIEMSEDTVTRCDRFFKRYPSEKRFYKSNVPDLITDAEVFRRLKGARENHTLEEFFQEKLCIANQLEDPTFSRQYFQYYAEAMKNLNRREGVFRFIIVDPAKTTNPKSAFTAILAVAIDPLKAKIYIRKLVNEHLDPKQMYDAIFEMAYEMNSPNICIEDTSLHEFIQQPMKDAATSRGVPVRFLWMKARGGQMAGDFGTGRDAAKKARAAQVGPYYQQGFVYHDMSIQDGPLEQQMMSYPRPRNWDALDCAGYIPFVMSEFGIHLMAAPKEFHTPEGPKFGHEASADEWRQAIVKRGWELV